MASMNALPQKKLDALLSRFSSLDRILVIGDVGIDKYTKGEVSRISPEAPIAVVQVVEEHHKLGLAANVQNNLKFLGIPSILCGVTGDDPHADKFNDLLREGGFSPRGIIQDPSRPTVLKERVTTDVQQICRIDYEDTSPIGSGIEESLFKTIELLTKPLGAVIIEDYCKGTLTEGLLKKLIAKFQAENLPIFIDPGKDAHPMAYRGATLLKPNRGEASLMIQALGYSHRDKTTEEMASILMDKLELQSIVVTLGKEGMAIADREGFFQIVATAAAEVFDVSGAGDTSIAVLAASLLAGAELWEAALVANCAAAVVVGKYGTATTTIEEIKAVHGRLTTGDAVT